LVNFKVADMVHVTTPNQPSIPDIAATRCGVQRQSMRTNVLIHRAGLSEVNKVTFTNPTAEKVFGLPKHSDAEGARDVTMCWKSHQANPNDIPGAPACDPSRKKSSSDKKAHGYACSVTNINEKGVQLWQFSVCKPS
jgi:hypothetical protein